MEASQVGVAKRDWHTLDAVEVVAACPLLALLSLVPELPMNEFKISVSRIEMVARAGENEEVCVTFNFERPPIIFQIPIFLGHKDFDDTEMIRAARDAMQRIFAELASQCESWSLSSTELQGLTNMNLRPATPTIEQ